MSLEAEGDEVEVDDLQLHHEIEQYLISEVDLLDTFELSDWLDLLSKDITLKVPVRSAQDPGSEGSEYSDESFYLWEDYGMLRERVGRLNKEYTWAENPRSRVRHVIGNVQVIAKNENLYKVYNNQHVYQSQGDTSDHDLLSAQRHTVLRDTDDGFRISNRTVYLDHNILNTKNLTLPLL